MKKTWILFLASIVFVACGTQRNTTLAYDGYVDSNDHTSNQRKVMYSASINLAVEDPYKVNEQLELFAKNNGGYVNELGTHQSTIRVISDSLEHVIDQIKELGKVKSTSIHGKDVTEEYFDQQIRLENALKARERYLELLEKAEHVEATLKVEKELERLNEKIELLKGRMNRIEHLTKYATVHVRMKYRKKPGILGYVGLGLYHSVKWLFVRN